MPKNCWESSPTLCENQQWFFYVHKEAKFCSPCEKKHGVCDIGHDHFLFATEAGTHITRHFSLKILLVSQNGLTFFVNLSIHSSLSSISKYYWHTISDLVFYKMSAM